MRRKEKKPEERRENIPPIKAGPMEGSYEYFIAFKKKYPTEKDIPVDMFPVNLFDDYKDWKTKIPGHERVSYYSLPDFETKTDSIEYQEDLMDSIEYLNNRI